MTYTYFDLESIPDQSEGALERARESVNVPGNYTKEETIEKYKDDKAQEAWEKTALDGWKGHVACIVANDRVFNSLNEKELIEEFFSSLDGSTLVGHNIKKFDIPFIIKRALSLKIKIPELYKFPRNSSPWSSDVIDTMTLVGGTEFISLDNLAKSLGIKGKGNTNGSHVRFLYEQGLHDEIAEYCKNDVQIVKAIHERFIYCGW